MVLKLGAQHRVCKISRRLVTKWGSRPTCSSHLEKHIFSNENQRLSLLDQNQRSGNERGDPAVCIYGYIHSLSDCYFSVDARHANLIPRDLSSPEPDLLPAEDMPHIPATLRAFHNSSFLPSYPPKHTYIRSPPSPPQRSTLTANLDKRMQNTAKVRQALKNLMDAAEKEEEQEAAGGGAGAAEPPKYKLTHSTLVNWQESFTLTRKRWKVSR